jgi:hypothetical protein
MTSSDRRRPLPALVFLAGLTLLSAIVWYRVLHRDGSAAQTPSASPCTTTSTTAAPTKLPAPRAVSVLVLNSTQRNGLAASTGKALSRAGFSISGEENDDPSYGGHGLIGGVGEIRYNPTQRASALLLSYYLPGAKLVPVDSTRTAVVVALGRTFKGLASKTAVSRALRAHAEAARPAPSTAPATATASPSCTG